MAPPMGLLAELTHRCPLQCPYCSNPLSLDKPGAELTEAGWRAVLEQAASLGILQVHFSGGEPMVRKDLPALVAHAGSLGLYTNIITSGVLLEERSMAALNQAGVDHIQLSFQDSDPIGNDALGAYRGGFARKQQAAALIRASGLPLTLNFVIHRRNVENVPAMIGMAEELGAQRVEIAHVQYYGWGLVNRAALLPTLAQLHQSTEQVEAARVRLRGSMVIDYVVPDYHANRPKACMGGWGRRFINITPNGQALPCHAAQTIPNMVFPSVQDTPLAAIWNDSAAFQLYRGTGWMPEPCRSCDQKEVDWGGCRCQAFALLADAAATDPACSLSPHHYLMQQAVRDAAKEPRPFIFRRMNGPGRAVQHAAD